MDLGFTIKNPLCELKELVSAHVYIGTWLSPIVAIFVFLVRGLKSDFKETYWPRTLLHIAFLTCLAVVSTPSFDSTARSAAQIESLGNRPNQNQRLTITPAVDYCQTEWLRSPSVLRLKTRYTVSITADESLSSDVASRTVIGFSRI